MSDEKKRALEAEAGDRAVVDPQWERAHQTWSLQLEVDHRDLSRADQRTLFRILRVKRMERAALLERLPGTIRRGAQIDLEPIETDLRAAGFRCALRRSSELLGT